MHPESGFQMALILLAVCIRQHKVFMYLGLPRPSEPSYHIVLCAGYPEKGGDMCTMLKVEFLITRLLRPPFDAFCCNYLRI